MRTSCTAIAVATRAKLRDGRVRRTASGRIWARLSSAAVVVEAPARITTTAQQQHAGQAAGRAAPTGASRPSALPGPRSAKAAGGRGASLTGAGRSRPARPATPATAGRSRSKCSTPASSRRSSQSRRAARPRLLLDRVRRSRGRRARRPRPHRGGRAGGRTGSAASYASGTCSGVPPRKSTARRRRRCRAPAASRRSPTGASATTRSHGGASCPASHSTRCPPAECPTRVVEEVSTPSPAQQARQRADRAVDVLAGGGPAAGASDAAVLRQGDHRSRAGASALASGRAWRRSNAWRQKPPCTKTRSGCAGSSGSSDRSRGRAGRYTSTRPSSWAA